MTTRPGILKSKERPSSAIYIGSDIPVLSPPNLPDLPEPPSPVSSVSSRGSGLPSPPATNSTGSGSIGGDNDNETNTGAGGTFSISRRSRPSSMNMLNESNVKTFQDALATSSNDTRQHRDGYDDDYDDEHNDAENEEDNTARLDRLLALKSTNSDESALQRVRSLTERNRMTLNKITAFSRLSTPSPGPSQRRRSPNPPPPNSVSSSSSSSHTASTRQSASGSSRSNARPRASDSSLLHNRSQSYAFDLTPEHLSGSETERESTRGSHEPSIHTFASTSSHLSGLDPSSSVVSIASASAYSQASSSQASSSQARPQTPPHPFRRRQSSAPSSPARAREAYSSNHGTIASRTRTPRKRASMAMTMPDEYDDYADVSYNRDGSIQGSRVSSRVGFVDRDDPVDDTGQRDSARAPSRTGSTYGRRTSRQPLPKEFRDHSYEDRYDEEVQAPGVSRQQSADGSVGGDGGVEVSSSARSASRASGQQLPPEPPTPHRPYSTRQPQQSPRKSNNWTNTARDLTRRHQSRWLSGEVTFADTSHERPEGGAGPPLGRRQSLRGGSAESALGLGTGRSLVSEGLRAAGLTRRDVPDTPSQRRAPRDSRDLDVAHGRAAERRPHSRLSEDTGTGRYSDSFRPSSRVNGQIVSEFRTPEHSSTHDAARTIATAPRAATSMASYRASLDGSVSRRDDQDDEGDEPRTAPLLRTYRSSVGLEPSTRVASALGGRPERYSSPFGSIRRREDGHTAGASSREQQAKHAELMRHSLDIFASNLEKLGLSGEGGRGGPAADLVKSAEDIVLAAERLNEMIKSGTNRALTEQIDAEVSGSTGDVDLVEVWRSVGGQWRDGLRVSDELVRSVTGFLLGVGRVVKDLSLTGGHANGHGGDGAHGRSISLDEEALSRTGVASPEVATTSSSSASGRRSVGSSRRSWEPTPRDRDREREETLRKLAGADNSTRDAVVSRPFSDVRSIRTQRETTLPLRASVMNVFAPDRRETTSTPQRGLGAAPDRRTPATMASSMRRVSNPQPEEGLVNSDSQETVHGYEPSPTPASRTQTATDRLQPLTHRALTMNALNALNNAPNREHNGRAALPPLSIPPPLATLASESLLQRNKTIATEKPSTRMERERGERRIHHQAVPSASTTIKPHFPVITNINPTTALTTVTASPESQLFPISRTDSDRSGRSDASRANPVGTFSRPSTVSVSTALTGLRDRDQRQRTISNTSVTDESGLHDGSVAGPSASAVKAIARAYGPMTPLSGSETERDTRRKTIGTRQGGRPSLDGEPVGPGARSGQSTITALPTVPARYGRPRRPTVTALFDES